MAQVISNFCYRLTELAYKAEKALERDFDRALSFFGAQDGVRRGSDRPDPQSIFGPMLIKLDEKRMNQVLDKIAMTPMGSELVGYAHDRLQEMSMRRRHDGSGASYCTRKTVDLDASGTLDYQVSAIVHELRHARQHHLIGDLMKTHSLPPQAAIVINRFIEADAYTFMQRFCEDFAEKTGDKGPLKAFMKVVRRDPQLVEGLTLIKDDATRFQIWAEKLANNHFNYDGGMLGELLYSKNLREDNAPHKSMISPEVSDKLILAAARQIDTCWPLKPSAGVKDHYLSSLSDKQLLSKSMTRMPDYPGLDSLVSTYAADYARKHGMNKGAPTVSAASAPSIKARK